MALTWPYVWGNRDGSILPWPVDRKFKEEKGRGEIRTQLKSIGKKIGEKIKREDLFSFTGRLETRWRGGRDFVILMRSYPYR